MGCVGHKQEPRQASRKLKTPPFPEKDRIDHASKQIPDHPSPVVKARKGPNRGETRELRPVLHGLSPQPGAPDRLTSLRPTAWQLALSVTTPGPPLKKTTENGTTRIAPVATTSRLRVQSPTSPSTARSPGLYAAPLCTSFLLVFTPG